MAPMTPTGPPLLLRSATLPVEFPEQRSRRTLLAPEDAYSPPRRPSPAVRVRGRDKQRNSSGSRRRKGTWKKLLWVKQSYPDNYTDQETFLEELQRNPRLQPYDFWPLVANSTVIVQHVCSVVVFILCFVVIFQERVSPVAVVTCGNIGTIFGWLLWDFWSGQSGSPTVSSGPEIHEEIYGASGRSSTVSLTGAKEDGVYSTGSFSGTRSPKHSHSASASSISSQISASSPMGHSDEGPTYANYAPRSAKSSFSPKNQQRIATAKSAVLIYSAVLGLSPILKSLTKSTSSDSIWALSAWLMIINVFFFDYGGGIDIKFPASLSTNAALMASTVLASRLPSTEHVFSLSLFPLRSSGSFLFFEDIFGISLGEVILHSRLHWLQVLPGGLGVVVTGGGWKAALVGTLLGNILVGLVIGGCSWWLIGLQKYKNEIHGPWDPARPILRRRWDD